MVTLKLAETADGFAAGGPNEPRLAITGSAANDFVHMQRALHDAILIGSGTAVADDPLLTVRLAGLETRKPLRVVFDTNLRLSPNSKLAVTAATVPTLVIAGQGASQDAMSALEAKHVEVVAVSRDNAGRVDLTSALAHLAAKGITRVFSEGGPRLGAALIAAGYADDVLILTSSDALGHEGTLALDATAREKLSDEALYTRSDPVVLDHDRLTRYERKL
jgi:diaminohydroxyphosphoribosylaminopyrimidine deaminase/5-amino-6-(5-phosphoribosylamino)uracil reductase